MFMLTEPLIFRRFCNGCTEMFKSLSLMPWEGPTLSRYLMLYVFKRIHSTSNISGPKRPGCSSCAYPFNRDNSTRSQPLGSSGVAGCTCDFRHSCNPPSPWSWSCFGSRRRDVHKPWHAKSYGPDEVGFRVGDIQPKIAPFQGQPHAYVTDDVCPIYAGHIPWPAR